MKELNFEFPLSNTGSTELVTGGRRAFWPGIKLVLIKTTFLMMFW